MTEPQQEPTTHAVGSSVMTHAAAAFMIDRGYVGEQFLLSRSILKGLPLLLLLLRLWGHDELYAPIKFILSPAEYEYMWATYQDAYMHSFGEVHAA